MGRFSAWMASRRKTERTAKAAPASPGARPLSFERCEQRIALSTNAAAEPPQFEPLNVKDSFVYWINDYREGGAVTFQLFGRDQEVTLAGNSGLSNHLFYGEASIADAAAHFRSNLRRGARTGNSDFSFGTYLTDSYSYTDGLGSTEATFVDSGIIPIPPPSTAPNGNEGGQIAMTPFIAPSMLGLPGANQSRLAAETRQSLTAEQLTPASTSGGAAQDSLRGRAVVYEVAHAQTMLSDGANVAVTATRARTPAEEAIHYRDLLDTENEPGFAASDRGAATHTNVALLHASPGVRQARTGDHAAAEADTPGESVGADARSAANADPEPSTTPAPSKAIAAARDAALEQLEDALAPIGDGREVAAATVDSHGKRVLGGALIAVAAVPMAKVVRRRTQRPVEGRPHREGA